MGRCHSALVTADTSRVVVVRAWRDSERIIIRVLAGAGHSKAASEWVFADIDAACQQIADILCELADPRNAVTREIDADTRR
jgi:hypothetical protein